MEATCTLIKEHMKHITWLSSRNLFRGGKIYCYANFSIVLDNFWGQKSLRGENCFRGWLSSRNFFRGGQNLLLCKFLLLCHCFRTKFQGGTKVFRGANCFMGGGSCPLWKKAREAPPATSPPIEDDDTRLILEHFHLTMLEFKMSLNWYQNSPFNKSKKEVFTQIKLLYNSVVSVIK